MTGPTTDLHVSLDRAFFAAMLLATAIVGGLIAVLVPVGLDFAAGAVISGGAMVLTQISGAFLMLHRANRAQVKR